MNPYAIAIHGGAGTILRSTMTPDKEQAYRQGLQDAIVAGDKVLAAGGLALDAVEAAIRQLEDNPLFNAGRGSVFTHEGRNEMDASVMDGRGLSAGAVAGVQHVMNPITLARAVMERSDHVFLAGSGAVEFARSLNLPLMPDDYFFSQMRYDQLQQAIESDRITLDHTSGDIHESGEKKFGTVGAVALDMNGNLAAGTSTGGMTNKQHGRIGDSPIIGAGTYANNRTCAISCTGHGELFIRSVVAYDVSCLMEYKGLSLQEACNVVVHQKLIAIGGEGGLIAIDHFGNIELPFNSEGMYRASKKQDGPLFIGIYKD